MNVCKNILENSLQKFLTPLLVLSFITFTSFAFAENKIRGKYEVIGSIEKLNMKRKTYMHLIKCV